MLGTRAPMSIVSALASHMLSLVEHFNIDYSEMRHIATLPLGFRSHARDPLAGVGIFHHAHAVPNEAAAIEFILEDTGLTLAVPTDSRCAPKVFARRWHTLRIEFSSNHASRFTSDVVKKNSPNDLGLLDHNFETAWIAFDGSVAVSKTTGMPAFSYDAGHSSMNLKCKVLQEKGIHRALESDVHFVDEPISDGLNCDAREGHALVQMRNISLIAR